MSVRHMASHTSWRRKCILQAWDQVSGHASWRGDRLQAQFAMLCALYCWLWWPPDVAGVNQHQGLLHCLGTMGWSLQHIFIPLCQPNLL